MSGWLCSSFCFISTPPISLWGSGFLQAGAGMEEEYFFIEMASEIQLAPCCNRQHHSWCTKGSKVMLKPLNSREQHTNTTSKDQPHLIVTRRIHYHCDGEVWWTPPWTGDWTWPGQHHTLPQTAVSTLAGDTDCAFTHEETNKKRNPGCRILHQRTALDFTRWQGHRAVNKWE